MTSIDWRRDGPAVLAEAYVGLETFKGINAYKDLTVQNCTQSRAFHNFDCVMSFFNKRLNQLQYSDSLLLCLIRAGTNHAI